MSDEAPINAVVRRADELLAVHQAKSDGGRGPLPGNPYALLREMKDWLWKIVNSLASECSENASLRTELAAKDARIAELEEQRKELDRRIHNQRLANRDTWEIVEMRGNAMGSPTSRAAYLRCVKWLKEARADNEALRKQLVAEFGVGEDTTTITRKSFAEVLQALADAQKELAETKAAKELVARQAEDEGLWFVPVTITEDYLQRALRSLHEAVEGRSSSAMILALIVGLALVASGAGHAQGGCVGNAGCALWTDCHDGGASFGSEGRIACLERELTAAKEKPVQRKYSLDEIDSMRQAVQTLHSPSPLFNGTWTGTSAAQIEDELRTYMANGTSPEELWKRINERQK